MSILAARGPSLLSLECFGWLYVFDEIMMMIKSIFLNIIVLESLNSSSTNTDARDAFFYIKELQYQDRRDRVAQQCQLMRKELEDEEVDTDPSFALTKKETFVYDDQDKLAYCIIAKVRKYVSVPLIVTSLIF